MSMNLKSILALLYCLFLSLTVWSQNTTIDSLQNELTIHTKKDSLRVNTLNNLAFEYYSRDINKALTYIAESKEIAKAINFKKGKAESTYIKGITLVIQSNFEEALLHFREAIELYDSIDYKKGESSCYNAIGVVYYYKGDHTKAIKYYTKSLKIDEERGAKKSIPSSLINIGSIYADLGNYSEAISYYNKALVLNKEYKNEDGIASSYNNLGTVYDDQGNYPLALEFYNKSLFLSEKLGDTLTISKCLNNIGIVYKKQENYQKALEYYNRSLVIQEKNGNKKNIAKLKNNLGLLYKRISDTATAIISLQEGVEISRGINYSKQVSIGLNNLGDIYLSLEDLPKALKHYEEAKDINLKIENKLGLCNSYLGLANIYFGQKQYKQALFYTLKSKEIADSLQALNLTSDALHLLFMIYKNTGDHKKALKNHEQHKLLEDSLFNKQNIKKIAQIENEYKYKQALDSANYRELELTQTVISTSQNLEDSQRNSLIAVIVILLISIVSGGIIFFLKLRHANAKHQNILIEQKLLRSQMTPHFIFNSLSVLQGMILNKEEKSSVSYLSKFSKLLRITLENSRYKTVSLSKELLAIDHYMTLQNLDVNPPYQYQLSIDAEINQQAFQIPPMLIQPFIENAIEHAFVNQKENKEISIQLTLKENSLVCTITDNGIGINPNQQKTNKEKQSLATTITSERLKMLSKEFKVQGSVLVQNRKEFGDQGTLITLVIPYKMDHVS